MQRLSLFNMDGSEHSDNGVTQVRAVIFGFLSIGGVILGGIALMPVAVIAFTAGEPLVGFVFLALYAWLLFFTFWKGLPLKVRILSGLAFVYLTGILALLSGLPFDIAITYLFAFAVLTGLLLDERASLIAVLVNTVSVIAIASLTERRPALTGGLFADVYLAISIGLGLGMMLLVATAVSMLVHRLQESLDHQQQLTRQLQREVTDRGATEAALQAANSALSGINRQLATILDIGSRLRWDQNPDLLLLEIARHHRDLGFGLVVLNVRDPVLNTMRIHLIFGLDDTRQPAMTDTRYTWEQFNRPLQERFRCGDCYFIPEGAYDWDDTMDGPTYVVVEALDDENIPDAERWHSGDTLRVPLRRLDGEMFGALSFDQPLNGRRPQPEQMRVLEVFAREASYAFENAEMYAQLKERLELQAAAEAELRSLNQELKRSVRHKDEFLASMSHELRTPLTAILGIAEALSEGVYGGLNEGMQRGFERIVTSGRELMEMIDNLLDMARYDAGRLAFNPAELSVIDLCRSCIRTVEPGAAEKGIRLHCEIDNPALLLQADPKRMKQILTHLLANAVKFTTDAGEVGIQATSDLREDKVVFVVWDTGIGIEPERLAEVFEPFVQLDGSLTRRYAGTGLGLALVSRLVRLHGGKVELESTLGKGTRVTVSVPQKQPVSTDRQPGMRPG